MNIPRIALGCAQFGLNYGISNQAGQVLLKDARNILTDAKTAGLDTLDTAIAYGDSEERLGQLGVDKWLVVTKLPRLPDSAKDISAWVQASVTGSLRRLKISNLDGLLLHYPADLLGVHGDDLYTELVELKISGLVKKIGISIYQPDELDAILDHRVFDIVQAPLNIMDRRLISSGWLDRLYRMDVEIHVRSIFMQGLLLMTASQRPVKFQRWKYLWDEWDHWLNVHQLSPLQGCLRYALSFSEIRRIIVGVESRRQLHEILEASSGICPAVPLSMQSNDFKLINPSNWSSI